MIVDSEKRGQLLVMYSDLRAHEEKHFEYTRTFVKWFVQLLWNHDDCHCSFLIMSTKPSFFPHSFDELLDLISSRLQRMETYFRNSIPPVERLTNHHTDVIFII